MPTNLGSALSLDSHRMACQALSHPMRSGTVHRSRAAPNPTLASLATAAPILTHAINAIHALGQFAGHGRFGDIPGVAIRLHAHQPCSPSR
jgi:hypothetical protein